MIDEKWLDGFDHALICVQKGDSFEDGDYEGDVCYMGNEMEILFMMAKTIAYMSSESGMPIDYYSTVLNDFIEGVTPQTDMVS